MERILRRLLTAPLDGADVPDVEAWWARHRASTQGLELPVDRAMVAALGMDRLGWAFASGYQEALRCLVPSLGADARVALCATEEGGNHPRSIHTRLEPDGQGWRMTGEKRFTTLGTRADRLLIVASEGQDAAGRNRLVVVQVPREREGMRVEAMPDLPFVPEIPHAVTHLSGVRVERGERLPGDGYADYLKPFRTLEDVHVHAAMIAWLLGVGRRHGWPEAVLARWVTQLVAARSLAGAFPQDEAVHVAVAGLIGGSAELLETTAPHWQRVDPAIASRWERDRALLGVAGKARELRARTAWERLGGGS